MSAGPLTPLQLRLLRLCVLEHAVAEHRQVYLPILHVGIPGTAHAVVPVRSNEAGDHALRTDIVAALRARSPVGIVWLTRAGALTTEDVDSDWHAAARQAYAEAGVPLLFAVVNRHGWRDPVTGAERYWKRLRRR